MKDKLPRHSDILDILTKHASPTAVELVRDALEDSARIDKIKKLFQEGNDAAAVMAIRDLSPEDIYKLLPLSSGVKIMPGESAKIAASPQIPWRPTRLLVGRQGAKFMIDDIKIGTQSQTVQSGSIPAELFAGNFDELEAALTGQIDPEDGMLTIRAKRSVLPLVGLPIGCPSVPLGCKVILVVTNVSKEPAEFTGAFLGLASYH